MKGATEEQLFWILQAVKDGELGMEGAKDQIVAIIGDLEEDAFTRGQDSMHPM